MTTCSVSQPKICPSVTWFDCPETPTNGFTLLAWVLCSNSKRHSWISTSPLLSTRDWNWNEHPSHTETVTKNPMKKPSCPVKHILHWYKIICENPSLTLTWEKFKSMTAFSPPGVSYPHNICAVQPVYLWLRKKKGQNHWKGLLSQNQKCAHTHTHLW